MPEPPTRYLETLEVFVRHRVDFIVIGGVGCVLRGAPITTFDVDIVHSRDPENLVRILAALEELGAWYREHIQTRLRPRLDRVGLPGPQLFRTKYGILDVIGVANGKWTYDDLLPLSSELDAGGGLLVRVLHLEKIVQMKEELGRDKDRAVLDVLRATMREAARVRPEDPKS